MPFWKQLALITAVNRDTVAVQVFTITTLMVITSEIVRMLNRHNAHIVRTFHFSSVTQYTKSTSHIKQLKFIYYK